MVTSEAISMAPDLGTGLSSSKDATKSGKKTCRSAPRGRFWQLACYNLSAPPPPPQTDKPHGEVYRNETIHCYRGDCQKVSIEKVVTNSTCIFQETFFLGNYRCRQSKNKTNFFFIKKLNKLGVFYFVVFLPKAFLKKRDPKIESIYSRTPI
eukprot:sb/3473385/